MKIALKKNGEIFTHCNAANSTQADATKIEKGADSWVEVQNYSLIVNKSGIDYLAGNIVDMPIDEVTSDYKQPMYDVSSNYELPKWTGSGWEEGMTQEIRDNYDIATIPDALV